MLMCSLYVTSTSNPRYQYYIVGVSSRSSRVAWARTSIHVQEYGTRHHHDIHLTPYYFLESVLEKSLQPRRFSNFSHRAVGGVGVCRQSVCSTAVPLVRPTPTHAPNAPLFCMDSNDNFDQKSKTKENKNHKNTFYYSCKLDQCLLDAFIVDLRRLDLACFFLLRV